MGREGSSRGTTHVRHPSMTHFALTNISLSFNVEITVQTTTYFHLNNSRGNFDWFLSSAISSLALHLAGGFYQSTFLCHRLSIGVACWVLLSAKTEECQGLGFVGVGVGVNQVAFGSGGGTSLKPSLSENVKYVICPGYISTKN